MEMNFNVAEKNLEDLEKEITCAICQELYTDPKILPCLHCYCKQCIHRLALRVAKGNPFLCPECRKDTVLPDGGEDELKSAFIINRLKSMYAKHKKALSKRICCEICTNSESLAVAFCSQCDKYACKDCMHMHSVMKAAFNGHECIAIEHLQKAQYKDVPKPPEPKKCSIHKKKLKIFCFNCSQLICRDCTVKDHRDHDIEFTSVAADNARKGLLETLEPLKKIEESLSQAITNATTVESKIQAQEMTLTQKIESSFEELHKIIKKRQHTLLDEVTRITKDKSEKVVEQKKKLSVTHGEVHSVIDHTEQYVKWCSDDEVVSMLSEVNSRIQTQIRECHEQEADLKLSVKADMLAEVDCAKVLELFCHDNTWVTSSTIPVRLEFNVPEVVEVKKEVKFIVYNKSDKIISSENLQFQFQCISTGVIHTAEIKNISSYEYSVAFTPTERGCYQLEISAYGYPVPHGPITVTAYLNPTQLTKPTQIWKITTNPQAIAINSYGEVIITDFNKALVLLNEKGETIRAMDMESLLVKSLDRLAIDCEDNIYYTGLNCSKIGKSDRCFKSVLVQDIQQVQGCGHFDIAISRDEVLVTEYHNKGQIAVYDRNLNFVKHISTGSKITLYYLCPDHQGRVYVSARDKTVMALDMNGNVLHSFRQSQSGLQILKNPAMTYVYGHYVYVADITLNKTVVFTVEGKYITSLDCFGSVYVGKDGIVYNCDKNNNCVLIF